MRVNRCQCRFEAPFGFGIAQEFHALDEDLGRGRRLCEQRHHLVDIGQKRQIALTRPLPGREVGLYCGRGKFNHLDLALELAAQRQRV